MVATVAEPVASRIPTATSQASSSAEMLASSAQSAITVPTPASIRVCLNPPPAATISAEAMASVSGMRSVNRVPAPAVVLIDTSPPIASMLARTT